MLLRRLLIKAQDWLVLMAGVSRQRVPLKRMREVLHAGQRLGVDILEVESLRLDIRRREWEDAAKKVPSSPPSHHSVPCSLIGLVRASCQIGTHWWEVGNVHFDANTVP
jgi:hypothetical protein